MELLLCFIVFLKNFLLTMSILYLLKVGYEIAKVYTLREGKVELGKYGLIYVGCSISYIMSIILS